MKKVLIVIVSIVIVIGVFFIINTPKEHVVSDSSFNLNEITDGVYKGECLNGLVQVQLEVEVKDHKIIGINLINHQNGLGEDAEVIIDEVIKTQSIEVDSITGATYSSLTILKAIEEALTNE